MAQELAALRAENARLLRLLRLTQTQAAPPGPAQAGFLEAPPGPVHAGSPPATKVALFGALFAARNDVHAIRWENVRTGKSGWLPAVRGGWRKGTPHAERDHLPLTPEVLAAHLSGQVHIGPYPLLDGDTCRWLAADLDGPAAMLDALACLKAARSLAVPAALEVSRSGVGPHAWVFFTGPVPAATAGRNLATAPMWPTRPSSTWQEMKPSPGRRPSSACIPQRSARPGMPNRQRRAGWRRSTGTWLPTTAVRPRSPMT